MHCLSQSVRRLPAEVWTAPSGKPRWLHYSAWFACLLLSGLVAICAPIAGSVFATLGMAQPVLGFRPVAVAAFILVTGGVGIGFWARTTRATLIGFALLAAGLVIDVALVVFFYWPVLHPAVGS